MNKKLTIGIVAFLLVAPFFGLFAGLFLAPDIFGPIILALTAVVLVSPLIVLAVSVATQIVEGR